MRTFITNDGVELAFHDSGPTDGSTVPLAMLHGWCQTQAMFRHQVTGLADRRRVVTLDQRGHGLSEKPVHGYRVARLARDAQELLDHLGIECADVLGWSMGASVWWSFMDQYGSGRIRRLVLVDEPASVAAVPGMLEQDRADSGAIFDGPALASLCEALLGPDGASVMGELVRGAFGGEPDPVIRAFVEQEIKSTPLSAAVSLLWEHCAQDWRDMLPRIDVPALVIGCDGSHIDPASQRYVAERIPRGELHVFPSDVANSHYVFLEAPEAFNALVEEFLERP